MEAASRQIGLCVYEIRVVARSPPFGCTELERGRRGAASSRSGNDGWSRTQGGVTAWQR
jgi:hypothetical protein